MAKGTAKAPPGLTPEQFGAKLAAIARVCGDRAKAANTGSAETLPALQFVLANYKEAKIFNLYNCLVDLEPRRYGKRSLVLFAEEDQVVVEWCYDPASGEVFQIHEGKAHSEECSLDVFLVTFAYWNAALGAAKACFFGSNAPKPTALKRFPIVWSAPGFVVRGHDPHCLVFEDGSTYVFGSDHTQTHDMTVKLGVPDLDDMTEL